MKSFKDRLNDAKFFDEDNVVTRGIKRGAYWGSFAQNNPSVVKWVFGILFLLLLFLIIKGCSA